MMRLAELPIGKLRNFIRHQGMTTESPTSEWEVLRWRVPQPVGKPAIAIIYRNAKDVLTFYGEAQRCYDAYLVGMAYNANTGTGSKPKGKPNAEPRRKVELFTDASNYHATKAGAWAAVLITPDGQFEASGPLKGEVKSSTAAEACAVANALHHFLRAGSIQRRDKVHVVCDNDNVVHRLADGKKSKRPDIQAALVVTRELRGRFDLSLTAEWIKGHQPKAAIEADPRVAYNHRCDELCGAHSKALNRERASA